MKQSLDESVNPCEDFWSFACGKWQDNHTIPDDKKEITTFDDLQEALSLKLKNILEAPIMSEMDPFYLKSAKKFYQKCTDDKALEEDDALGGFPMLDKEKWEKLYEDAKQEDKDKKIEAVFMLIVEMFKFGHEYKSIIVLDSMPDMTNTSRTILGLSQGQLYETELENSQYKKLYKEMMKGN